MVMSSPDLGSTREENGLQVTWLGSGITEHRWQREGSSMITLSCQDGQNHSEPLGTTGFVIRMV